MALVLKPPQKGLLPNGKIKVDLAHPLANGLMACYVPGVSGGINLVGTGADLAAVTAATNNDTNAEGPSFSTTNSPDGLRVVPPAAFLTGSSTLYWRGKISNITGGSCLFGIEYANPHSGPWLVWAITENVGTGFIQLEWNSAGSYSSSGTTTAFTAGAIQSFAGTFQPGGNAVLYKNGAATSTTAFGASSPNSGASSTLCLQTDTQGGSNTNSASSSIACIWNRALSASEVAALDADPYAFLIPAEGEMPALFLPAAGGSFLAAWARNSNLPVIGTGNF